MFSRFRIKKIGFLAALAVFLFVGAATYASHSWGGYHWARTANPFIVKLGDNVSTAWEDYLAESSVDWSQSAVLETSIVPGSTHPRLCRAASGRIEVCNSKYGYNGWLGIASIWVSGGHITKGTVKLNDSYFNKSVYNKPAWRRLVMCQEIAHVFGLSHQDENFYNTNLQSCMDYTANPDGPPSNEHPNTHDYQQLEEIYAHVDSMTTLSQSISNKAQNNINIENWLNFTKKDFGDMGGKFSVLEHHLGNGDKLVEFITWLPE